MDLPRELIEQSRESYLGANVPDFLIWVRDSIGIEVNFPTDEILQYLKEVHWDEYLDALEYSKRARFEVLR